MARKRNKTGTCCICGKQGPLSFEHVPPRAAFNKEVAIQYTLEERITKKNPKGKKIQGGIGDFTLCRQCNTDTGNWYGREYADWAQAGMEIIKNWTPGRESNPVTFHGVYPLRFLKQVVTCFFSDVGKYGPAFTRNHPELIRFVLEKENMQLPSGFRFFMNLYRRLPATSLRRYPIAGRIPVKWNINTREIAAQGAYAFSEIAHPPFQLLMFQDDEDYPEATEITHFKDFEYDEEVADLPLQLRIVKSSSPYPGADY